MRPVASSAEHSLSLDFLGVVCEGEPRGESGRERNPLASRVYVVIKNYEGQVFHPPVLYTRFQPVKELCTRVTCSETACSAGSRPSGKRSWPVKRPAWPSLPCAMSEAPSASELSQEQLAELHLVWQGGSTCYDYEVGCLTVGEEESRRRVAVILVANFEDRVVAAFPHRAWSKTPSKRELPPGPFTKPMLVEVRASAGENRGAAGDHTMKIWVGLLRDLLPRR